MTWLMFLLYDLILDEKRRDEREEFMKDIMLKCNKYCYVFYACIINAK
mgnify:CR=1